MLRAGLLYFMLKEASLSMATSSRTTSHYCRNSALASPSLASRSSCTPHIPPRLVGYRAREVLETKKPTQKSDVYSFGVLLLEMLTGKAPLISPGRDDSIEHLPRWVQSVVREEWPPNGSDAQGCNGMCRCRSRPAASDGGGCPED